MLKEKKVFNFTTPTEVPTKISCSSQLTDPMNVPPSLFSVHRAIPFVCHDPQCRLARNLRCGFGTLVAQNGVLHYVSFKIDKKLRVFLSHIFSMLPCGIFRTVVGPLNLYQPYGFVLKHFEFLVQNAYWFHLEIPFVFHLEHNPINYVVVVR
jgi:hypothetical protein